MNKVLNSVQQIVAECDSMLEHTEHCEFLDIKMLATTLRDEKDELLHLYNDCPEKGEEISLQKIKVEDIALKLEFYLYARMGLYTERRELRLKAEWIYKNVGTTYLAFKDEEIRDTQYLSLWSKRANWALDFFARSQHILFEIDEDDKMYMSDIEKSLRNMKGVL